MSCSNIFAGGAKKTLDAAKFVDAEIKINNRDWDGAIETILSMTTKYKARSDVKFLLSSAYAGKCGLDFLAVAQRLSQQGGTSNLFQMLLSIIKGGNQNGADADIRLSDYCMLAEDSINSISTDPAERNADQNTLAAFIGLSKATVALAITMDIDGDGVADATNPCTIPDGDADHIVTGVTSAYLSLQEVGGTIGEAFVAAMLVMCGELAGTAAGIYDFCPVSDIATITADQRRGARGMVRETANGFGLKIVAGTAAANAPGCP